MADNKEFGLDFVNVRLTKDKTLYSTEPITNPQKAVDVIRREMEYFDREHFVILCLNAKGQPINASIVSVGALTSTNVDFKQVFKTALLSNAAGIILFHNHPSGDITPSMDDKVLTQGLVTAGKLMQIDVLDHIVVGDNTYYSFRKDKLIEAYETNAKDTLDDLYSYVSEKAATYETKNPEPEKVEKKKSSFRDMVAEAFIKSLEEDPRNWVKGWCSNDTGRPFNMASNREYNGLNAAWLKFVEKNNGYKDPRWLTFNQVKQLNEKREEGDKIVIPKGTKMTQVEYFFMWDNHLKKTISWEEYNRLSASERGQKVDSEGNLIKPGMFGNKVKERYELRSRDHYVFNASQLENIPEYVYEKNENDIKPSEVVNRIAEGMGVRIREVEQDRAYYRPSMDLITLPLKSQFDTDQDYQATALHELGHATGHETRLNRNIHNIFGSPEYAYEELIAEMTSCFMGEYVETPMSEKDLDNHLAYVQNWIEAIGKDKNYLFRAIKEADRAADYMIAKGNLKELTKERDASLVAEDISFYGNRREIHNVDLLNEEQNLVNTLEEYFSEHDADFEIDYPEDYFVTYDTDGSFKKFDEKVTITLGWYTNSGQDRSEDIRAEGETIEDAVKDFLSELDIAYDNFDKNEYVNMWLNAKASGTAGIPDAVELVETANEIESNYYLWFEDVTRMWNKYIEGTLGVEQGVGSEAVGMTKERAMTIAYNAIIEGQIEERLSHEEVLSELGISQDEWREIMDDDFYEELKTFEAEDTASELSALATQDTVITRAFNALVDSLIEAKTPYSGESEAIKEVIDELYQMGFTKGELLALQFEEELIDEVLEIDEDEDIETKPHPLLDAAVLDDIMDQMLDYEEQYGDAIDKRFCVEIIDAIAEYKVKDHEDPEWKITDEFEDIENIELAGSGDYLVDENGNEHPAFVTLNLIDMEATYEVDGNKNIVAFENLNEVLNWVKGNDWDSYMQEAKVYMESESAFDKFIEVIPSPLRNAASMVMQYIGDEFSETDEDIIASLRENFDITNAEISNIGLAYSTDEEEDHEIQVKLNLSLTPEVSYYIDNELKKTITFATPMNFEDWFRWKEFSNLIADGGDIIEENYDGIREVFVSEGGEYFTILSAEVLWQEGSMVNGRFTQGQRFESVAELTETLKKQDKEFRENEEGGYDKTKVQIHYITPNNDIHFYTDRFDVGDGEEYMDVKRYLGDYITYIEQALPDDVEITEEDEAFIRAAKEKYKDADMDDYNLYSDVCDYLKQRGLLEGESWNANNKERFLIRWFEGRITSKTWDGKFKNEPIVKLLSCEDAYDRAYIKTLKDGWYYAKEKDGFGYIFFRVDQDNSYGLITQNQINVNSLDLGFDYVAGKITYNQAQARSLEIVETAKNWLRENIRSIDPEESLTRGSFEDKLEYGDKSYEERNALDKDARRIVNYLVWEYKEALGRIFKIKGLKWDDPIKAGDYLPDATRTLLEGETYDDVVKMDIKEALDAITNVPYYDHILEYAKYLIEGDKAVIEAKYYEMLSFLDEEEASIVEDRAYDLAMMDESFRNRMEKEEIEHFGEDAGVKEDTAEYTAYAPVFGYIYDDAGMHSGKNTFLGTPENIANFIMFNQNHPVVITDMVDNFIISSVKGGFLDRAASPDIRNEVVKAILPLQIGDKEPVDVLLDANTEKSPYEELAQELDNFMYGYDTYSYMDEIEDRREAVESTMALLEDGDTEGIVDYLMGVVREGDYMVVEAAELLDKIEKLIPQSTISFYVAEDIEFNMGKYEENLSLLSAIEEYRALNNPLGKKGLGVRLGLSEWPLIDNNVLDLSMLKLVPFIENNKKVQEAIDYIIKEMPELTVVGLDEYLVDETEIMPNAKETLEDRINGELAALGYNLEAFDKISKHPDDSYLYTVLAYRNTFFDKEYATWLYNADTGLQNGKYNLSEDLAKQFYYEWMQEALRPPYRVTMYGGKFTVGEVKDVTIDELLQSNIQNTFAYFYDEDTAKEYIKENWRSTYDVEGKDVLITQIALELYEYDDEGDLISKELIYHTEKPVELNPEERTLRFEAVDAVKKDYKLIFEADGSNFEIEFNSMKFEEGIEEFAKHQLKNDTYWAAALERSSVAATDDLLSCYASEGVELIDRKLPGNINLTAYEENQIKDFFKDGITRDGFDNKAFERLYKEMLENSDYIDVDYGNYQTLEAKALSDKATQEDINRLGEWFERFGDAYWNGESYRVDGKEDVNLYPIHKEIGDGDFDIVGYSFSEPDLIKEDDKQASDIKNTKTKETDDELE